MNDSRVTRLAEILLDHSCQIQAGEKLLIEAFDMPDELLVCELVELSAQRGALPLVSWKNNRVLRSLYQAGTEQSMSLAGGFEQSRMQQMDAYIGIRGTANSDEFSDVSSDKMELYQQYWWQPVHIDVRVPDTRWVVLRYPTASMAQASRMSTSSFEEFYFRVCTADYGQMAKNQEPLRELMLQTDRVRIVSPGTDLAFSIKDIPVIACHGGRNIPDGEVFTAPVRDSVNGTIQFNAASRYQGTVFQGIVFEFKDGKIVNATCENAPEALNRILDSDEGARYIGEWSLGCNNHIQSPMLDTLFDEKIGGSFHLTPGNAYDVADNGNRSRIHWDLVSIQTPAYGGGQIYFDDQCIRENGRFLPESLSALNTGL